MCPFLIVVWRLGIAVRTIEVAQGVRLGRSPSDAGDRNQSWRSLKRRPSPSMDKKPKED